MNPALLIPIIVPLGLFAMIFGIVYLRTRENMALLEKGINPRRTEKQAAPFQTLKNGLLIAGAGIGLLIAYLIDRSVGGRDIEAVYFALLAIGGGLGLIISYSVERKDYDRRVAQRED